MTAIPSVSPTKENIEISDIEKKKLAEEVEKVEGTVRLFDAVGHVRKIPIPSKDPRDPLTWPLWKRAVVLLSLCVFGIAGFGVVQSTPLFFSELIPMYIRASRGVSRRSLWYMETDLTDIPRNLMLHLSRNLRVTHLCVWDLETSFPYHCQ